MKIVSLFKDLRKWSWLSEGNISKIISLWFLYYDGEQQLFILISEIVYSQWNGKCATRYRWLIVFMFISLLLE